MAWRLIKVSNLSLGNRVLIFGSQGTDVTQLQRLLKQTGFYFGKEDGLFGPLTEEAVRLFQKAYQLRIDGVAGPELFKTLSDLIKSKRIGRIIYTVKERDSLQAISQKYAVNQEAWESLYRQINRYKKIYPGMKLLLHEKALFVSDNRGAKTDKLEVTGRIQVAWKFDIVGNLNPAQKDEDGPNTYNLISAESVAWEKLFHSPKVRRKLISELKKLKGVKFGFDLRDAPLNTIWLWPKFLKTICHYLKIEKVQFLLLPLILKNHGFLEEIFWLSLPQIICFINILLLQPVFEVDSPELFEISADKLHKNLKRFANLGFFNKIMLAFEADGWDWNLDKGERKRISYKKARIIRAMNSRTAKYSEKSKMNCVNYLSRGEHHTLIYRDREGWLEVLKTIKKMNFLGVAIFNYTELGKTGRDIIASSFAVLPEVTS